MADLRFRNIINGESVDAADGATYDLVNAFRAIQSQPGLNDEQREKALARLVMTGLLTGAIMTVSIRGERFHCSADGEVYGPERHRTWRVEPAAYSMVLPR